MGAGTATAAKLITSGDIKDGTIKSADIKNGTIKHDDIKKSTITRDRLAKAVRSQLDEGGPAGPPGRRDRLDPRDPLEPRATRATRATPAQLSRPATGVFRTATRSGRRARSCALDLPLPAASGPPAIPAQAPPFGTGSLNLVVSGQPTVPAAQEEKVAYGNEFDFVGDSFQDLTAVGFHVYTTVENIDAGGPDNLPSITFEVDPERGRGRRQLRVDRLLSAGHSFPCSGATTSMPPRTAMWGGTGPAFTGTPCDINGTRCTLRPSYRTLAQRRRRSRRSSGRWRITKGRDNSWQGAVDGLRINDTVYDFEETGVFETAP